MTDPAETPLAPEEITNFLSTMDSKQLSNIVAVGERLLQERQFKVVLDFFEHCKNTGLCVIPKPKDTQHFDVLIDESDVTKVQSIIIVATSIFGDAEVPYSVNISKYPGEEVDTTISIVFSHPLLDQLHIDMEDGDIIEVDQVIQMISGAEGVSNAKTT